MHYQQSKELKFLLAELEKNKKKQLRIYRTKEDTENKMQDRKNGITIEVEANKARPGLNLC